MRWRGRRQSTRVDDRRGRRVVRGGATLGGGALVIMLLYTLLTGDDPGRIAEVLNQTQVSVQPGGAPSGTEGGGAPQDEMGQFVSVVLADTEDTWQALFSEMGRNYELPTLVLFSDAVNSACGFSSAAVGPFYCPADRQVYIDLGFFADLDRRFGAPGDFAQAYVIAHEVGHHVQNLLGISGEVHRLQQRGSREQANELSVRLELQADCLAGVWGYHAQQMRNLLEPGDVEEGLAAAAAVGDDRIQSSAGRAVQPESWTHGSSRQRAEWFLRGLEGGRPGLCDTFQAG